MSMRARDEQSTQDDEVARGAAYTFAFVVLLGMGWVGLRADDPLNAVGLALVTFAALLATPTLVTRVLSSRGLRRLVRVSFVAGLLVLAVVLALAYAVDFHGSAGRALVFLASASAAVALYAGLFVLGERIIPRLFHADDHAWLEEILDTDERVWLVAGIAFLVGTALQFAAAT